MMHPLNPEEVTKAIPPKTPGIFKLMNKRGDVKRVGMAETDLAETLQKLIHPKYEFFEFKSAAGDKAAWQQLCEAWHYHRKNDFLESDDHPQPPRGKYWTCHVCEDSRRY